MVFYCKFNCAHICVSACALWMYLCTWFICYCFHQLIQTWKIPGKFLVFCPYQRKEPCSSPEKNPLYRFFQTLPIYFRSWKNPKDVIKRDAPPLMPHRRCLALVSKYLIYLLISNKYAVFSFEICDKTIKEVALTISQVFIAILSSILDFRVGKDTETLSWLRT